MPRALTVYTFDAPPVDTPLSDDAISALVGFLFTKLDSPTVPDSTGTST